MIILSSSIEDLLDADCTDYRMASAIIDSRTIMLIRIVAFYFCPVYIFFYFLINFIIILLQIKKPCRLVPHKTAKFSLTLSLSSPAIHFLPHHREIEKSKTKKLKHVKIYNELYEPIQNGTYPPGSQLPPETSLSTTMNVSRMTLRKALTLLREDGLIKNVQGVGHFVREPKSAGSKGRKHTKKADSLSFIPIELVGRLQIDLNSTEALLEFLEHTCYEQDHHCSRCVTYSTAGNFSAKNYKLSSYDSFLMTHENVYDENEEILVVSKHYIPAEMFELKYSI